MFFCQKKETYMGSSMKYIGDREIGDIGKMSIIKARLFSYRIQNVPLLSSPQLIGTYSTLFHF
jgi:hypothetical protein